MWAWFLSGAGIGMVGGFWLACCLGIAKESDRQAEIDFMRLKLEELRLREGTK